MKILFSALQYPNDAHPFAAFISMMAKEMLRNGHSVTVVCPQSITKHLIRNSPLLPEYEEIHVDECNETIKIYRPISLTFGSNYKFLGRLTVVLNRIVIHRCIKKIDGRFDVAYAHFWESAFNVSKITKLRNLPLTVVSGEDKILLTQYLNKKQISELKEVTTRVIAVSSKNKNESIKLGLVNESRCHVIPNGPDLRVFHPINKEECRKMLGFADDYFIVAFVGRFIHRKGAKRIENAILQLKDPKIKAIFIGSTMTDESTEEEPIGDEIIYKGVVPHNNIPIYLNAADIYVLPTLAEGCSNSIVEAMACGLPIISSDMDFNYDVLKPTNSLLIDPMDIDSISTAIKTLKENSKLRASMSKSSVDMAKELDFRERVDKIITILEDSIKNFSR